jgi:hypothetical protein
MHFRNLLSLLFLIVTIQPGHSQRTERKQTGREGWDRTRSIIDCAPRLVDRRDLVQDRFDHLYVTTNPRDIEVGYFSVEPVTYHEQGLRFCEALLPAAGVSETRFRGTYTTTYQLPGDGLYSLHIHSRALIFNNEIRIINAQSTFGKIAASHRMELEKDPAPNPPDSLEGGSRISQAYVWEVEISQAGELEGIVIPGDLVLTDREVPAGFSNLLIEYPVQGPGVVTIKESVIFTMESVSPYKYDPIFQAPCLFILEPLDVSARLLPCGF